MLEELGGVDEVVGGINFGNYEAIEGGGRGSDCSDVGFFGVRIDADREFADIRRTRTAKVSGEGFTGSGFSGGCDGVFEVVGLGRREM